MNRSLFTIGLCTFLSVASVRTAFAGPTAVNLVNMTDALFNQDYASKEKWVAQGRIGDRGGNATYEASVHDNTNNPGKQQANVNWISGTDYLFSVVKSGTNVTLNIAGTTTSWTSAPTDVSGLFLRARAINNSSLNLTNLSILQNGTTTNFVPTLTAATSTSYLAIGGINNTQDFSLFGTAKFNWTGPTAPTNSNLAFQVKAVSGRIAGADPIPESTTMVSFAAMLGLVGFAMVRRNRVGRLTI